MAIGNKQADLVVLLPSRTNPGSSLDWLIIIEHKSYYKKGFYQQMFEYQLAARKYYFGIKKRLLQISSVIFYHGHRRVKWRKSLLEDDFKEDYQRVSTRVKRGMVNYALFVIDTHAPKVQRVFTDTSFEIHGLIKLTAQTRDIKGRSVEELRAMLKKDFSYIMKDLEASRARKIVCQIMAYIKELGNYTQLEMQEVQGLLARDGL